MDKIQKLPHFSYIRLVFSLWVVTFVCNQPPKQDIVRYNQGLAVAKRQRAFQKTLVMALRRVYEHEVEGCLAIFPKLVYNVLSVARENFDLARISQVFHILRSGFRCFRIFFDGVNHSSRKFCEEHRRIRNRAADFENPLRFCYAKECPEEAFGFFQYNGNVFSL